MKIIEITISPIGESTVQTKGFTGASCRDASRLIEQALGEVRSDVPTPEFYQPVTNQQTAEQKIGG